MFAWFQKLLPRTGNFFNQFEAHSKTIVASSKALALLVRGGPDMATHIKTIEKEEHKADEIIREVLQDVRRIFLTPFDRGAITALINAMDDAVDQMHFTAGVVELYDVTEFTPEMVGMVEIIVESAVLIEQALPLLRDINANEQQLHNLTSRLVKLEDEADKLNFRGSRNAFIDHGKTNATQFVVVNEIYRHLEKVCDRCEDVGNQIDGLVIDHA